MRAETVAGGFGFRRPIRATFVGCFAPAKWTADKIKPIAKKSLHTRNFIANYKRRIATFGEEVMIELVSAIGFYAMVAMTLNAFSVSVPGGNQRW